VERIMEKFKFLEHTADAKFQAFGKTLDKAFANSALAMFNVMYKGKVAKKIKEKIKVKGNDKESLLYNFLEELLFLLDTKSFFVASAKVKIKNSFLEAEVSGDSSKNYKVMTDVKAVTYNEMFIKHEKDMWVCQVVVDV
jgi:SHS2 domain-containing protein